MPTRRVSSSHRPNRPPRRCRAVWCEHQSERLVPGVEGKRAFHPNPQPTAVPIFIDAEERVRDFAIDIARLPFPFPALNPSTSLPLKSVGLIHTCL
ncbi:hypothetical protein LshimejAT787_0503320 [Lyophyllum shimeji]|uniref:Uncharacterized protein n=1 Tax=Lyophyllum shimeji TaxID=47721 RepID=A0A9P3PLE1_LYOSH|nr:hypothetical protein LshimejAT787_0503320 [Lyophyllum shimeji]